MSFKAKDLHYEKQEPAFLRRLKGAYDANDGRSNVQIARPKKDRLKTGDGDDDEPLILDENGDVVGKKEFDGMVNGLDRAKDGEGSTEAPANAPSTTETDPEKKREEKRQLTNIGGGGKKRKQAKAIGGGSEDEDEARVANNQPQSSKPSQSIKGPKAVKSGKDDQLHVTATKLSTDKPKKKAKKIKLSFDEPE